MEVIVDRQDKHRPLNPREIEKIFADEKKNPDRKPEWYCESSELSLEDQKWIWDNIPSEPQISHQQTSNQDTKARSKVKGIKGSMVTNMVTSKKKDSKDKIAFNLAKMLDDLENLPWYEKLVNERRCDFLGNCLVITFNAYRRGVIKKTKAAYFTGVVKQKTAIQERIKRYKQKHTT